VPGVASVQARVPARREDGREFQALGLDAQMDRSPTVFNLKVPEPHNADMTNYVNCLYWYARLTFYSDAFNREWLMLVVLVDLTLPYRVILLVSFVFSVDSGVS